MMVYLSLSQTHKERFFISSQRAVNLSAYPVSVTSTGNSRLAALCVGDVMKRCGDCKERKLLTEFHKDKNSKDGLNSRCKLCNSKRAKEWRLSNPEKAQERSRQYYQSNTEKILEAARKWQINNPEKAREKKLKWKVAHREQNRQIENNRRASDPEKARAKDKRYYESHKEDALKSGNKWRAKNPEKTAEYHHARRARILEGGGTITAADFRWLKSVCNYACLCCGKKEPEIKLTLDHVVALARGGSNTIGNAQVLCGSCNARKSDKTIDYRTREILEVMR